MLCIKGLKFRWPQPHPVKGLKPVSGSPACPIIVTTKCVGSFFSAEPKIDEIATIAITITTQASNPYFIFLFMFFTIIL